MLKDLDLAVLGGHFMNDPEINKYQKLVDELLKQYTSDLLSDCYISYNNIERRIIYNYAELRSKTQENALEKISNASIDAMGCGLSTNNLNIIKDAVKEI